MKALPSLGAMGIAMILGFGLVSLGVWWPIAVAVGFVAFAGATSLIERHIRNGAERRALRDYEKGRRGK